MSFLLDTNVVSETRKATPDPNVMRWMNSVRGSDVFLSVLVVGEIRQGIERLRRRDPIQASALDNWLTTLRVEFVDRTLPITTEIAEEWARLNVPNSLPIVDGLIAATARVMGLTVVTRNIRDFPRTAVSVLDPFRPPEPAGL